MFISSLNIFSRKFVATPVRGTKVGAVPLNQTFELNIANNGVIFLRNAKVISVSDGGISVNIGWGSTNLSWLIETNSLTKFFDANGQTVAYTDISDGSNITVTGQLAGADRGVPLINAQFIRVLQ